MGADHLFRLQIGRSQAGQHCGLADEREDHHHVAAGTHLRGRALDIHVKALLPQQSLGPDDVARMGKSQQPPVGKGAGACIGSGLFFEQAAQTATERGKKGMLRGHAFPEKGRPEPPLHGFFRPDG